MHDDLVGFLRDGDLAQDEDAYLAAKAEIIWIGSLAPLF